MPSSGSNPADSNKTAPPEPFPEPYYFEGGLRRVKPYHYTYNTFCKERWRDRELLDIFQSEFRDRTPEYYVRRPGVFRDMN
jgi:hypothetical protein